MNISSLITIKKNNSMLKHRFLAEFQSWRKSEKMNCTTFKKSEEVYFYITQSIFPFKFANIICFTNCLVSFISENIILNFCLLTIIYWHIKIWIVIIFLNYKSVSKSTSASDDVDSHTAVLCANVKTIMLSISNLTEKRINNVDSTKKY